MNFEIFEYIADYGMILEAIIFGIILLVGFIKANDYKTRLFIIGLVLFILFGQNLFEFIFHFNEKIPIVVFALCGLGLVFCVIQTIIIVYLECKKNKTKDK